MTYLSGKEYEKLLQMAPIPCIDLWLEVDEMEFILVRRNVPPYKGYWAPPGGRIRKGESLERARKRIAKTEVGVDIPIESDLLGVYSIDFGWRHDIVLSYYINLKDSDNDIKLDYSQSSEYIIAKGLMIPHGKLHADQWNDLKMYLVNEQ